MKAAVVSHRDLWSAGAPSLPGTIADLWHALTKDLFDPYHPEKHYMRGPGPKWHERHGQSIGASTNAH